jgi:hypothetical protein
LVVIGELGYPELTRPRTTEHAAAWARFEEWRAEACPHPRQNLAQFDISWAGMGQFRSALEAAGGERFPVLLANLPEYHHPFPDTPASTAPALLAELHAFRARPGQGPATFLIDEETDEPVAAYEFAPAGGWVWLGVGGGVEIGYDSAGFFVQRAGGATERDKLFRARRLEQRFSEEQPALDPPDSVEYVDRETGRSIRSRLSISGPAIPWPDGRLRDDRGRFRLHRPRFMRVEQRAVGATQFANPLNGLEAVCRAAIETGNPILWG